MLKAYIVPHPPIILPEIGRGEELKIAATTTAYQAVADEIAELKPDTIVLSSPHSPLYADGFFVAGGKMGKGDFSAFSAPEVKEEFLFDSELSERLCRISQEKGLATGLEPQIGGRGSRGACSPAFYPTALSRFQARPGRAFRSVRRGTLSFWTMYP